MLTPHDPSEIKRPTYTVVANKRLEAELELRVSLDPAIHTHVSIHAAHLIFSCSLDGITTPARTSGHRTLGVRLRELLEDVVPPLAQVNERSSTPVFGDRVREVLAEGCRARWVWQEGDVALVRKN